MRSSRGRASSGPSMVPTIFEDDPNSVCVWYPRGMASRVPPMSNGSGPYLGAAFFCQQVLNEDGVLSAIRIVDRVIQHASGPEPPEAMPPLAIPIIALIILKSGEARGSMRVQLRPEDPSGLQLPAAEQMVHFEGEERGYNVVMNVNFVAEMPGLYWFDVLLDGNRITRIPLRVMYMPTRTPG